jgi:hypothetical protein
MVERDAITKQEIVEPGYKICSGPPSDPPNFAEDQQVGETPHSPTIIIGRERSFFTGRISDDNFNVSYTLLL